jgi:hypothetical protein
MSCIINDKAITVNGKTWWVNSAKSGLFSVAIKKVINQVDAMLSHHSKVLLIRFDLHLYEYTDDNSLITIFNRRLHKWLKRKYNLKRVGFAWAREMEISKHQHYHYVLMVDGHKVNYPSDILFKIKEIWDYHMGNFEYTPENCFYNLKRNDHQSTQDAIWRISYIVKGRGKGYKPDQTKNYGTSRIKSR